MTWEYHDNMFSCPDCEHSNSFETTDCEVESWGLTIRGKCASCGTELRWTASTPSVEYRPRRVDRLDFPEDALEYVDELAKDVAELDDDSAQMAGYRNAAHQVVDEEMHELVEHMTVAEFTEFANTISEEFELDHAVDRQDLLELPSDTSWQLMIIDSIVVPTLVEAVAHTAKRDQQ